MTGRLYLHVGPPKTGTTALQIALQNLALPGWVFLGCHQPRDMSGGDVSWAIHEHCAHGSSTDIAEVSASIAARVFSGETVVLSEECFLFWEERCDFWTKLERLEQLFADVPRTYLVTLRSPADALPSYFQELYEILPAKLKLNPNLFFEHSYCDCYDYKKLRAWFAQRNLAVHWIMAEQLRGNVVPLAVVMGPGTDAAGHLSLPVANTGRKEANGKRHLSSVTVAELAKEGRLSQIAAHLKLSMPLLYGGLRKVARALPLRSGGAYDIKVPPARMAALMDAYNAVRSAALAERGSDSP